jgi:hypothetical protein
VSTTAYTDPTPQISGTEYFASAVHNLETIVAEQKNEIEELKKVVDYLSGVLHDKGIIGE